MAKIVGGDKLEKALNKIASQFKKASSLEVGFIDGATYPDGISVAAVATYNEFGAHITIPAHEQSIYRKIGKDGEFLQGGRFVRQDKANFETSHQVEAYSITIPPRPFFRNMVQKNSADWPKRLSRVLKDNNYDVRIALGLVGQRIQEDLQRSIRSNTPPPNAESTAKAKRFNRTLIDTGVMLNSVTHSVK